MENVDNNKKRKLMKLNKTHLQVVHAVKKNMNEINLNMTNK